jgi:hypothetical protein
MPVTLDSSMSVALVMDDEHIADANVLFHRICHGMSSRTGLPRTARHHL